MFLVTIVRQLKSPSECLYSRLVMHCLRKYKEIYSQVLIFLDILDYPFSEMLFRSSLSSRLGLILQI